MRRLIFSLVGLILIGELFRLIFPDATFEWKWDLGGGLLNLVGNTIGSLVGVLVAFRLDRRWERRRARHAARRRSLRDKERYAQELDVCLYDLSTLLATCERIVSGLSSLSYMFDELNYPAGIQNAIQSPRLRRYGSYPLTLTLTSFSPMIATIRPLLELCRTQQRRQSDVDKTVGAIERFRKLILFAQREIEKAMQSLGYGTVITADERATVTELRNILKGSQ
jgi:hypothetical protein